MATVYAIGTNQNGWSKGAAGNIPVTPGFTPEGDWCFVAPIPSAATGRNQIASLAEANSFQMTFFAQAVGSGDSPSGKKARARVWMFNSIGTTASPQPALGTFLCEVEVTFGTKYFTGSFWGTGVQVYFPVTIEVVRDATITPPGARFAGAVDSSLNAMASMLFDSMGASAIVIEMQNTNLGGGSTWIAGPITRQI